ncbi:MAG: phenylacetate--CoA ligase [Bacteroidetes bacterium HGW-Bacteroidetes-5]|jgi:phenylacetate-CoA ligase|nr:MAG: phenylacetate--CoA ligase [Bacteroidetes bacterium HGW-Bacteroidetes-5]
MKRDPLIQFKSREEIGRFQDESLKESLTYISGNSPYYKRLFREAGIDINSIKGVEDLAKIPTTCKQDLQIHNSDFLCVPKEMIRDFVTTSGTLGDPVNFMLTENDLQRLAYNEKISFSTAGCSRGDVIQLMTTIDKRFMAGLAYFLGARELGAGIIRVGNGIPELQWSSIKSNSPSACIVVPSFLIKLAEFAEKNGIDYSSSSLKRAICIGEPLREVDFSENTLTKKIKQKWPNISLHSTYASTEMQSSFTECEYLCGAHHQSDLVVIEILDENENRVAEGETGELVITTLGVEGMPLVRFKTGDICMAFYEQCRCGRNSTRLSPIVGRKGQMIKYKGTTLYPSALYDILDNIEGVINYQVQIYTNSIGTDGILIKIGAVNPSLSFEKVITEHFRARIRVAPEIRFEPVELLSKAIQPEVSRKPLKFIDMRESG